MFKKNLDDDVKGDTSGNFCKLLLALVQVSWSYLNILYNCDVITETEASRVSSSIQTKRDEPSNVVDYEKIDLDARVRAVHGVWETRT